MITKILVLFVPLSLILGLYPNVLFLKFGFYLLDIAVVLIFIRSLFLLKYRIKALDIFILLFFIFNILLILLNFKLLISYFSFLYLFRFCVYFATYPFFVFRYKKYPNFSTKSYILALYLSFILNLVIFALFPNLNINGFDPHKFRLYGQFLDPNYYSVFLILNLHLVFNFYKSKFKPILVLLIVVSLFLTLSRLGLLGLLLVCLLNFSKKYSWYFALLSVASILFIFTNSALLNRLFFIEGNLNSFLFRIFDFFDGVNVYKNSVLPSGFNNMAIYNNYLTSNTNNSSSYYDFWPLNLILSGGIGVVCLYSLLFVLSASKIALKPIKQALFILLFASLGMNVLFYPTFTLYFSALMGVGLSKKVDYK